MQRSAPRGLYNAHGPADTSGMDAPRLVSLFALILMLTMPAYTDTGAALILPVPRCPEPHLPDGSPVDLPAASAGSCTQNESRTRPAQASEEPLGIERGLASWYGGKFQGRMTANGEIFDTNELTAAHRTLPFDTVVRVVNPEDGSSVTVRINDRGPFIEGRIIDLSRAAAEVIGISGRGVAPVVLEILEYPEQKNYRIIQVGSFGNQSNAEALRARLRAAGLNAVIELADGGVHRVVLPEVPRLELEAHRDALRELGFPNVLVREP